MFGVVFAAAALTACVAAGSASARPAARASAPPVRAVTPQAVSRAAADSAAAESNPWQEARTLADAGRHDAALAVVRSALATRGDDFSLRWLEAGITGEAGRHRESVALYEKLARNHPDRSGELLGDLAAERLWADDPAGAARDFRRWLVAQPGDRLAWRRLALALAQSDSLKSALAEYDWLCKREPGDNELALERARVLAWMGRQGEAIVAYRGVLARDPGNAGARLGVAMNENWAGRHRAATRLLEEIARDPAADTEALKALAFARYWDADPAGARAALDDYLRRMPQDREGRELSRRLARESGASLRFEGGRADDSDDLRIVTTGMELRWPLSAATTALFRWRRDNLRDAGGERDPLRLTAGLSRSIGAAWSVHGELTNSDWGDSAGTPPGGELGLVSRPMDHVRLEAGVSREPVLTRSSVALGISLLNWFAAADLALSHAVSLHADGRAGLYSDHNGLERSRGSLRWQVMERSRAEFALSLAAEQLHTHFDPGHGYYSPDLHREWGGGVEARWHPQPSWTLGVTSQMGWQGDRGGDPKTFYSLGARIEGVIAGAWTIESEVGTSDSSLQAESGYRRHWWQAALTRGF
jgi:cytochrome c-type biogenesis protein CcmH/NrfG